MQCGTRHWILEWKETIEKGVHSNEARILVNNYVLMLVLTDADVNIWENWVRLIQDLSVPSLQLICKSKITLK